PIIPQGLATIAQEAAKKPAILLQPIKEHAKETYKIIAEHAQQFLTEHLKTSRLDYFERIKKREVTLGNTKYLAYLLEPFDYLSLYNYDKGKISRGYVDIMRQFFLQNDTKQRINSQIKEISTL